MFSWLATSCLNYTFSKRFCMLFRALICLVGNNSDMSEELSDNIRLIGLYLFEFFISNLVYEKFYAKYLRHNTIFELSSNKTTYELYILLAPEDNPI